MKLTLKPRTSTDHTTISELYVDGVFECYILEDVTRPPGSPKVPGETAIPAGTYEVTITHSPKFGRLLPLLNDVPGFSGIRIHPGNDEHDTQGCLLPGKALGSRDTVLHSIAAFSQLFKKLQVAKSRIFIEVGR